MQLSVIQKTIPVIKVSGEVDHFEAPRLKAEIGQLLDRKVRSLVLDLSDVSYIDSGGITVLFWAMHQVGPAEGRVGLVVTGREVRSILDLVSIPQLPAFSVYETAEEAVAALSD